MFSFDLEGNREERRMSDRPSGNKGTELAPEFTAEFPSRGNVRRSKQISEDLRGIVEMHEA